MEFGTIYPPTGGSNGSAAVSPFAQIVASAGFKRKIARHLDKRSSDTVLFADSIGAAQEDPAGPANAWMRYVQAGLLQAFDPDRVHGLGFLSSSPPSNSYVGTGFDWWKTSAGATSISPLYGPTGGYCVGLPPGERWRLAVPATKTIAGATYATKAVQVVYGRAGEATTFRFDAYATANRLLPDDAFIAAGSAPSKVLGGLAGVTGTVSDAGDDTMAFGFRSPIIPIAFDGATQNPAIQITGVTGTSRIEGLILYGDDLDAGVRVHDLSRSSAKIQPMGHVELGYSDTYSARFARLAWTGRGYGPTEPTNKGGLEIWEFGVNDRGGNVSADYVYREFDAMMTERLNAGEDPLILWAPPYCPGADFSVMYSAPPVPQGAYGSYGWSEFCSAPGRALVAKYPDNFGFLPLHDLLGDLPYAQAITARGWNAVDAIHWAGGGPAWASARVLEAVKGGTTGYVARLKGTVADGPLPATAASAGGPLVSPEIFAVAGGWIAPAAPGVSAFSSAVAIGDARIEYDFRDLSNANVQVEVGVSFRTTVSESYVLNLVHQGDGNRVTYLTRNGVVAAYFFDGTGWISDGRIYRMKILLDGGQIRVIRNGTQIIDWTDPTPLAAGRVSLSTNGGADTLQIRDLSVAPT